MSSAKSSLYLSVAALAVMAAYCLMSSYRGDWISVLTGPVYFVFMAIAGGVAVRRRSTGPIATVALVRVAIGAVIGVLELTKFRFLPGAWEREVVLFVPLTNVAEDARVEVRSDWLACHESCIPGDSVVSAEISRLVRRDEATVKEMVARIPEPAGDRLRSNWTASQLHVEPSL